MRKWKSLMLLGISAVMLGGCSMKFSAEEDAVYVNEEGPGARRDRGIL